MQLRAPAFPLITVDPFFSVWSETDNLTDKETVHWTGFANIVNGIATIDGKPYRFMGGEASVPAMTQVKRDMNAVTTTYVFEAAGVRLTCLFTSPLLLDDYTLLTRPVSYLEIKRENTDGKCHDVKVTLEASEQLCLDMPGDDEIVTDTLTYGGITSAKMGSKNQIMLDREGDSHRISWGYLYLSAKAEGAVAATDKRTVNTYDGFARANQAKAMTFISITAPVGEQALFTFSYDDNCSIQYFHKNLRSWWTKDGAKIEDEIVKAFADYACIFKKATAFADQMFLDGCRAGGEKYAELLELAYRQTLAAHKLVLDENGEILWISKECYSNGCAATVDVTYPSIPLFLLYNPELVKGMMRPVYRVAESDAWEFDFAPHDAGRYPILNGQMYGYRDGKLLYDKQMPVEECGNMLIMEATVALATKDTSFAKAHWSILCDWVKYLIANGRDPENQLCTDDFAGHLAHNCNLSLKAIMGLASFGILNGMLGNKDEEGKYLEMAREMAKDWAVRAQNADGSYRLAFDCEGTFSMKYNIVWDKVFGTNIMPKAVLAAEVGSYWKRLLPFGMPLDNRATYTKSDWLIWTGTLFDTREEFEAFVAPMWLAFHTTPGRVPMSDWYWTDTGLHKTYESRSYNPKHTEGVLKSFRNRTVQGGLFMKLLAEKGILKYQK